MTIAVDIVVVVENAARTQSWAGKVSTGCHHTSRPVRLSYLLAPVLAVLTHKFYISRGGKFYSPKISQGFHIARSV